MRITAILYLFTIFLLCGLHTIYAQKKDKFSVAIFPEVKISVEGVSELNRRAYFSIQNDGRSAQKKIGPERLLEMVKKHRIYFGIQQGVWSWWQSRLPKPNKKSKKSGTEKGGETGLDTLTLWYQDMNDELVALLSPSTQIYAMEMEYNTPVSTKEYVETVTTLWQKKYPDWARPIAYSPRVSDTVATKLNSLGATYTQLYEELKGKDSMQVGGPEFSLRAVASQNFDSLRQFIQETNGKLDYYAFSLEDTYTWNEKKKQVQYTENSKELWEEGMLRLLEIKDTLPTAKFSYFITTYGNTVKVRQPVADSLIANANLTLDNPVKRTNKKRSIANAVLLRSLTAKVLDFMNYPKSIVKSIPGIYLTSVLDSTSYVPSLWTSSNFMKTSDLKPTEMLWWYQFFSEVEGDRIASNISIPGVQSQCFRKGRNVFILLNNHNSGAIPIELNVKQNKLYQITIKRLGHSDTYLPYYKKSNLAHLDNLILGENESICLKLTYSESLAWEEEAQKNTERLKSVESDSTSVHYQWSIENYENLKNAVLEFEIRDDSAPESDIPYQIQINSKNLTIEKNIIFYPYKGYRKISISIPKKYCKATNTIRIVRTSGKPEIRNMQIHFLTVTEKK